MVRRRKAHGEAGAALRLPSLIPQPIALEMLLTGDPVDAERASALGLVNRVVPEGSALDGALELAGKIAANGPLAVAARKSVPSIATVAIASRYPGMPLSLKMTLVPSGVNVGCTRSRLRERRP